MLDSQGAELIESQEMEPLKVATQRAEPLEAVTQGAEPLPGMVCQTW